MVEHNSNTSASRTLPRRHHAAAARTDRSQERLRISYANKVASSLCLASLRGPSTRQFLPTQPLPPTDRRCQLRLESRQQSVSSRFGARTPQVPSVQHRRQTGRQTTLRQTFRYDTTRRQRVSPNPVVQQPHVVYSGPMRAFCTMKNNRLICPRRAAEQVAVTAGCSVDDYGDDYPTSVAMR